MMWLDAAGEGKDQAPRGVPGLRVTQTSVSERAIREGQKETEGSQRLSGKQGECKNADCFEFIHENRHLGLTSPTDLKTRETHAAAVRHCGSIGPRHHGARAPRRETVGKSSDENNLICQEHPFCNRSQRV